jgi:hypothetical protein
MHSRCVLAAIILAASFPSASAQVPVGSEFRWACCRAGNALQIRQSAAMDTRGDFVLTWPREISGPPRNDDVLAQRFSWGEAKGDLFTVNSYTPGLQNADAVAIDDAGNFVVAWQSDSGDGSGYAVIAQRFDRSGNRRGGEFVVNTTTALEQGGPAVAVEPAGGFVIAWTSRDQNDYGIFAQRFDASGDRRGGEFQVNTTATGLQNFPSVDMDGAGNFVVVWQSGGTYGVRGQRFAASGVRLGAEFEVHAAFPATVSSAGPSIARSRDDGSFVVSWYGTVPGSNGFDVFARRFDTAGTPLGSEFRINVYTTADQWLPSVAMSSGRSFVVAWTSLGQDGDYGGIFARRFDSSGAGGPEFRVNSYTTGHQYAVSIAGDRAGRFVVGWHSNFVPQSLAGAWGRRYAVGLVGTALEVDGAPAPTSDGNGVLEPGEAVGVWPSWLNANAGPATFTGTASSFSGPGAPGDPSYTIVDASADYGTVAAGGTGRCALTTFDCYGLGISVPSARPAAHWDTTFREQIAPSALDGARTWTLHVGDSYGDVPRSSPFYRFVEILLHNGVTTGCAAGAYCPSTPVTREQMAVFALVAKEGAGYTPPGCVPPNFFADVPETSPFCRYVEELVNRGVVTGCGNGNYCPAAAVSREQMAVFMLRVLEPSLTPAACAAPGPFGDVPASSPFCPWIQELAARGVVAGCGGGNYCPTDPVTREQMSVFIGVTFRLALYAP